MKRIILLIIVIILISPVPSRAEKMLIAILDLEPKAGSKSLAGAVTDIIRSEMVKTGLYIIIERTRMNEILKEQEFQASGCSDQTCAVQIGKLLSAKKVLLGEINKIGKTFMITVRIVDVEKGTSEFAANEKADSEDKLDVAAKNITISLSQNKGEPAAPPIVVKKPEPKEKKQEISESPVDTQYYLRGAFPGWAQIYSGHQTKGIAFGTAFVASAIWTTIAILNYKKSKDDYESLGAGLSQDKYNSAYDKYKKDSKIATYSIIGTSLIYIVNWADVLFFSTPGPDKSLGLINYDNVYVNLNVNCYGLYKKLPNVKTYLSATMRF